MPNLRPNSTNYVHSYEPNTNDLTMAMTYNSNGEPCIRVLTNLVNGGVSFSGNYNDLSNKPVLFDPSNIAQSLLPDTDVAYDLGSPTKQWRDLYLSGSSIFLGGVLIALNEAAGVDLPANTTIDGVLVTSFSGDYSDLSNRPSIPTDVSDLTDINNLLQSSGNGSSYTLPVATDSILGGIKIGTGLAIDVNGIVSVTVDTFSGSYNDLTDKPSIPADVSDLTDVNNLLQSSGNGSSYTLPVASNSILGGIKIGTGLNIDVNGVVSAFDGNYINLSNTPTIPTAISDLLNDTEFIKTYTVTQSDVTQHQSALLITESQISDLGNYLTEAALNSSISLKANTADLATVATSGSYEDLTDKPNFNLTEDDLFAIAIIF